MKTYEKLFREALPPGWTITLETVPNGRHGLVVRTENEEEVLFQETRFKGVYSQDDFPRAFEELTLRILKSSLEDWGKSPSLILQTAIYELNQLQLQARGRKSWAKASGIDDAICYLRDVLIENSTI